MMKAIGTALVLLLWSVVAAGTATIVGDWLIDRLDRKHKNASIAWLGIMGTARRVK